MPDYQWHPCDHPTTELRVKERWSNGRGKIYCRLCGEWRFAESVNEMAYASAQEEAAHA